MRFRLLPAASGLLWFVLSIPAHGITCFQVWNNQDVLAYQSSLPPFDLSTPAFDRAMTNLRSRGGQLIFFESSECALVGTFVVAQGQPSPDPATLLIDMRGAVPRSALLSPMGSGVAPTGVSGGSTNARPSTGTNIGTPSRTSVR